MVTVIFLIVSSLILTPVMLLLPIGFSRKWKLGLVGFAFVLANVGLMANLQLPLYQTLLIIFLLCLLISLLLEKRIVITTQKKVDFKRADKKINAMEKEILHREDEKQSIVLEKEIISIHNEVAAAIEIPQEEYDLREMEISLHEEEEAVEEIQLDVHKNIRTKVIEDSLDVDEDVSFLENRVVSLTTTESAVSIIGNQENQFENAYMSEIEKLLVGNDEKVEETEEIVNTNDPVSQPVMEELEEIVFNKSKEFLIEEDNTEIPDLNEEIEIEELVFHK